MIYIGHNETKRARFERSLKELYISLYIYIWIISINIILLYVYILIATVINNKFNIRTHAFY